MLTRLGEAGADAFAIMRIAGQSSVTVSQGYVHPTPEGMERAFERLQKLNTAKFEQAQAEACGEAVSRGQVPKESPKVKNRRLKKSSQIIELKSAGA
jgi:hypothetical protein